METPEARHSNPAETIPPVCADLAIAGLAGKWFGPEPMADPERTDEHRVRIAGIFECDVNDPDVDDIIHRLADGGDPLLARVLARFTLVPSHKEYALAVDAQTGLKTYEGMQEWLTKIFSRSLQPGLHVSENIKHPRSGTFFAGDLINFKRFNDRLGEHIGDAALKVMAEETMADLRSGDKVTAARGNRKGDEILLAFVDLDATEAEGLCDRKRRKQMAKLETLQAHWAAIEEAIAPYEDREDKHKHIQCKRVARQIEGKIIEETMLVVNEQPICRMVDLTVINWAYAHGVVSEIGKVKEFMQLAQTRLDISKKGTHKLAGGAYRNNRPL